MICIKCKEESNTVFHTETYPCDCGQATIIEYNACKFCGGVWKAVNGEPILEDALEMEDIIGFKDAEVIAEMLEELEDIINDNSQTDCDGTMEECIHRCVNCNALAYETSKDSYKCSTCSTEWMVN